MFFIRCYPLFKKPCVRYEGKYIQIMKKYNMKPIENLMDESINKLSKLVEDGKHKNNCGECGQEFDMRDLSQVFAHEPCNGFVDYDAMEQIPHSGAIRIGEPILHTKNNGKINLN